MLNLHIVKYQPRWRVAVVAALAKLMGVTVHVEGIPFGSTRSRKKPFAGKMGGQAQQPTGHANDAAATS